MSPALDRALHPAQDLRLGVPAPAALRAGTTAPRAHPLFRRYPLNGSVRLSTGHAPTPYHVYDGHGVFIGGTADLGATRDLLARERVVPVQTRAGRALMGLWVFDFTDASLGAHQELQFSIFVSRDAIAPVTAWPLGLIELMLTRPDVLMLCHGLWNNAPGVVAYNRELLALNARESRGRIEHDARGFSFAVSDKASLSRVVEGRLHRHRHASPLASLALATRLGVRRLAALSKQPWIAVPVLNPVGAILDRNAAADTYTACRSSAIRYFDRTRDRLVFGDTPYRHLQFQPRFFQYMDGFRFVYVQPH